MLMLPHWVNVTTVMHQTAPLVTRLCSEVGSRAELSSEQQCCSEHCSAVGGLELELQCIGMQFSVVQWSAVQGSIFFARRAKISLKAEDLRVR